MIGFKYKDGFLYYYNNNISKLVRMDTATGAVEPYGNYDSEKLDATFALGFTEDDTLTLANTDGSLSLATSDGKVESIGRINYQLNEEGIETIINHYLYVNGKHYVTDGRYFDAIYEYDHGNLERIIDVSHLLNLDTEKDYDYYSYVLNGGIAASDNGNGKIIITFLDTLFYTTDMDQFIFMDDISSFKIPSSIKTMGLIKFLAHYLMYGFGLISFILLFGSILKWRLSLRSKLFIIIIPLSLLGIIFVSYYEMHTIEKDFKEQQYEEYDAISSFYRNQIDSDTLCSIKSLDDTDQLEQIRQNLMANLEADSDWTNRVNINVYRYFDNDVHLLLYSTTTDCLFISSFLLDFDTIKPYRVGDTDTYHYETSGIQSTYLDSITFLRDNNGEIYGFVDVYGDMNQLKISENQMKKKVLLITIILGVISTGVNEMANQIEFLFNEQEEFTTQVIETLVGTIDAKDKYTNGHSILVAKYSKMIAEKLGKSHEECKQIYYVGLLHDIGKIGVPDEIINKTARLTDEEFAIIKTHPDVGYKLLRNLTKIENVSIGAHYHHERFDGRGYPEGLKGEEIPEIARIIAVADTYDAMTSNRSYRTAMSQEKVRGELEKGKGTQFDAKFAEVMLEIDLEIADTIYADTK